MVASAQNETALVMVKQTLLITGGSGQLAVELSAMLRAKEIVSFALSKKDLDITNRTEVRRVIEDLNPDVVINTAAFTNVDGAESEEELATLINGFGVKNLAEVCNMRKIKMVQVSTDYVFSGDSASPYEESSIADPKTAYGRSKALGEKFVTEILPDASWIVRTAWLYSHHGSNFVNTVLRLEKQQEILNIVEDQFGQPTWTKDLAEVIVQLVQMDADPGIYHGTNSGQTTWFEFARKIFELSDFEESRIKPIKSVEYPRPARRPNYSVLGRSRLESQGLTLPRPWADALAEFLRYRG
jgi:dTDP-4-dehydrorhamnose reductase